MGCICNKDKYGVVANQSAYSSELELMDKVEIEKLLSDNGLLYDQYYKGGFEFGKYDVLG